MSSTRGVPEGVAVTPVGSRTTHLLAHEQLAARELAAQVTAEQRHLDALVRADAIVRVSTEIVGSPATCDSCGAAVEWVDGKGWLVHSGTSPCRQTPTGDHYADDHCAGDHGHAYGPSLAERARAIGTEITECPECGTASVLHVPGHYPVCQCCAWTGWERDEVAVPESARPR